MIITIMAQNLGLGGMYDDDGNHEDRWPILAERIQSLSPAVDILLLSEVLDWDRYGHKQLSRAKHDLDMDALPLAPSQSGLGTAVLYRKETVGSWMRWNTDCAFETLHGFGVATFDVGLTRPLSVVPAHLAPYDAGKAMQEADLIATRGYRYGPYAVLAGDVNFPPAQGPEPLYSAMLPYNISSRTELTPPGDKELRPNRQVSWIIAKNGYVDAAWHLYTQTGDESLLERTATDDRIDQAWVSNPLAPALISYSRLDKPVEASNHDGIAIQIDTNLADTENLWNYR